MTDTDRRDIINHVNHFGAGAVCKRMGSAWFISFREFGFPTAFKTKRAAMEHVGRWMIALHEVRRQAGTI